MEINANWRQNQTKNQLDIDVDFTKSENCIANNSELYINLKVKPNKSKIANFWKFTE